MQHWQQLKQQAIDGELRMEEGIGEALRAACSTYIGELNRLKREANQLQYLSGYGGLDSAIAIRNKFQDKAVKGSPGRPDDSAIARLDKHIEIAQLMHDTYAAAIGRLQNTDQNVGSNVTSAGEGIR